MAQHISIRVPWHDDGWKGTVCVEPSANMSCLRLKNIQENRNDEIECDLCGMCMVEHEDNLPCIGEGGAFMSENELHKTTVHPYKKTNPATHGHFLETEVIYPAYSFPARPFAWLMKNDIAILSETYGIDYHPEYEPILQFKTSWIQDARNHRAIFDYFYKDIILLKNSPLIKVIGVEKPVRPGIQCEMIPEFAISKIKLDGNGKSCFKNLIVDTQGKSQYGPLLEDLGCRKADRNEIYNYLKSVVKDSIANKSFREQLYAYLSGNQGNFAFPEIGNLVLQLPVIPVKTVSGTEYISYSNEIYTHNSQVSQEGYYILDENVMSYKVFTSIFNGWGKISVLNDETLLLRYQNKLKELIEGSTV